MMRGASSGLAAVVPGHRQLAVRTHLYPLLQRHLPLVIGLTLIVVPSFLGLAKDVWSTEEGAHGPIILASGIWLASREFRAVSGSARAGSILLSLVLLCVSSALYVIGATVDVLGVQVFAAIVTGVIIIYAYAGGRVLLYIWFTLFYLFFLVPLPDVVISMLTQKLQVFVSGAAADALATIGYPVANTGVTIQAGQYELLVAAACSGLNSIVSLSAIGLFYIYLMHRSSRMYALILMLAIVPMAVLANLVRVIGLVLVAYYTGDAAIQGVVHGLAGVLTFAVAVSSLIAVDRLLTPWRPSRCS